jgi:hypothetical protein
MRMENSTANVDANEAKDALGDYESLGLSLIYPCGILLSADRDDVMFYDSFEQLFGGALSKSLNINI